MPSSATTPALVLLGFCFELTACSGQSCDRNGQPAQIYSEGSTNSDKTFYETAPFDGTFLLFPSGRTYRLPHGLGSIPTDVNIYLAFVPNPLEKNSLIAPSAGNQGGIQAMDETSVTIRNDTCAEFFLRVTAHNDGTSAPPETDLASSGNDAATAPPDAGS